MRRLRNEEHHLVEINHTTYLVGNVHSARQQPFDNDVTELTAVRYGPC
jgi:hypothetical protein